MGQGRGGIAQEEQTRAAFVKRRQKVYSGRGAITGQYLVDGEQYKGEVSPGVQELITAAESDATDAVNRARIPRRYHSTVKNYFSDIQEELGKAVPRSATENTDPQTPSDGDGDAQTQPDDD